MAHIDLPIDVPGIRGLMLFRPETAQPLNHLVNALLRDESSLSRGEREMISAAFCMFNRYVDGLGTWTPQDRSEHWERAKVVVEHGYGNALGPRTAGQSSDDTDQNEASLGANRAGHSGR